MFMDNIYCKLYKKHPELARGERPFLLVVKRFIEGFTDVTVKLFPFVLMGFFFTMGAWLFLEALELAKWLFN